MNAAPARLAFPTAQSESPEITKVKKAATQFEAMLLAKWWSSMKESGLGGNDETDPGHDTLDEMGIQAMSTAVASGGGLGIGAMLVRSLLSKVQERDSAVAEAGLPKKSPK